MNYKESQELIKNWATERGIFEKGTPVKQAYKTLEECGELLYSIGKDDKPEIKDALGDILVTILIQCEMQGLLLEDCFKSAYGVISERKGKMVNGTFVKD